MSNVRYKAVVVGGGFYGCSIAAYVATRCNDVLLVEQESELFTRASYGNQARVHNGYHYPRSLQTAYRSRVNFDRFVKDYGDCVVSGFTKVYGIARQSKVGSRQFERFCAVIGAPVRPAREPLAKLFNPRLMEAVYEVREFAFNSNVLREMMRERLAAAGVEVRLSARVSGAAASGSISRLELSTGEAVEAETVFNCTYAGIKYIPGLSDHCRSELKQEIAEMALIEPPSALAGVGVTVMCGPFFSTMPFPPRSLHTLSHVRYTPHASWLEDEIPYDVLQNYRCESRAQRMLKDAQRYLPLLADARVVDSIFEIKSVLARNECDDGRPILVERSTSANPVYSILGGKIDNIYDVMHRLKADGF